MNGTKPLSWQKLRHVLDAAGVLAQGWKIGAKRTGDMVAVIWFPGDKPPGVRRTDKLLKVLLANGVTAIRQDANSYGIPKAT